MRTHYSVPINATLANAALSIFEDFPNYLDDAEADCGLNRCGLMLLAPAGARAEALRGTLAVQRGAGIAAREIDSIEAQAIHPLLRFGADEVIGWEPSAGYADAYLTLSA